MYNKNNKIKGYSMIDNRTELEKMIYKETLQMLEENTIKETFIIQKENSDKEDFKPKNCLEALEGLDRNIDYLAYTIAYRSVGNPRDIELNVPYLTNDGSIRVFTNFKGEPSYRTAVDEQDKHVYSRIDDTGHDNGRTTGSNSDYNHPLNIKIVNGYFVKAEQPR